jgi:hypothetical protein
MYTIETTKKRRERTRERPVECTIVASSFRMYGLSAIFCHEGWDINLANGTERVFLTLFFLRRPSFA